MLNGILSRIERDIKDVSGNWVYGCAIGSTAVLVLWLYYDTISIKTVVAGGFVGAIGTMTIHYGYRYIKPFLDKQKKQLHIVREQYEGAREVIVNGKPMFVERSVGLIPGMFNFGRRKKSEQPNKLVRWWVDLPNYDYPIEVSEQDVYLLVLSAHRRCARGESHPLSVVAHKRKFGEAKSRAVLALLVANGLVVDRRKGASGRLRYDATQTINRLTTSRRFIGPQS